MSTKRKPKNRVLTVRVDDLTAQELKTRAYNRIISVNSWILQAIAERMAREDKAN